MGEEMRGEDGSTFATAKSLLARGESFPLGSVWAPNANAPGIKHTKWSIFRITEFPFQSAEKEKGLSCGEKG